MAYQFRLPDLGEGIAEGHIVKWLVKVGDKVEEHQEIVELETDKALVKVPSPKSGTILEIDFKEGETINVGQVLCSVGEAGEKISSSKLQVKSEKQVKEANDIQLQQQAEAKLKPKKEVSAKKKSSTVIGELEEAPEDEETLPAHKTAATKEKAVIVSALPSVRKLAKEMNVKLSELTGSGKEGRITEDDIRQGAGKAAKTKSTGVSMNFDRFGRTIKVPLKGMRKKIAENMVKSATTIPHVTHQDWIDVTKLAQFRKQEKEKAEQKGIKLTFLPFIIKAVVLALKQFPYVNTSLDDETSEIIIKQYYNIGIGVDTPAGLMVPVIKHANEKTIVEIARDIWKLAEMSRTREIKIKDLQGGTFTITNYGSIGGVFGTPVINHPECAILGLGRIQDVAVPMDGKLVSRKMLPVSLSFDHRIIDGATAARFVNSLKEHLKEPDNLFMGY